MNNRICEHCGEKLGENDIFCGKCGHCSANTTSVKNSHKKSTFPNLFIPENATADNFISRAKLELEFGDFAKADSYCECALNLEAQNAKAYYFKLLIENKVTSGEKLALIDKSFENSRNYTLAKRYGDSALKTELDGYLNAIKERELEQYKAYAYNKACSLLKLDEKAPIAEAIKLLDSVGDYKDAYEKVVQATSKLEDAETVTKINTKLKKEEHDWAVAEKKRKIEEKKQKINESLDNIYDYIKYYWNIICDNLKNAWAFICEYKIVFFITAILIFAYEPLEKWYFEEQKNSEKYRQAENYLSESQYYLAFKLYNSLGNYSDSEEKLNMLKQDYADQMLKQELDLKGKLTEFAQSFDMVTCLPGEFTRNNSKIINKNTFFIGKYLVTQKLYTEITGKNPSLFKGENKPVECVSWYAASEFCRLLNEATKDKRPSDYVFDLPTEAQWEYACRAGCESDLNNGKMITDNSKEDPNLDEIGWYAGNSNSKTHNVGLKKPNLWGIYDMHGNVWEWCKDWYADYSEAEQIDASYFVEKGSAKVCRGGSWVSNPNSCTASYRMQVEAEYERRTLGFRIVLVPTIF